MDGRKSGWPRSALTVRAYRPTDADAVSRLACHGALFDVASPDTPALLEGEAGSPCLHSPGGGFWVAEASAAEDAGGASGEASGGIPGGGELVGTVAVVEDQERVARLRHLRVAPAWQDSPAAQRLVEAVVEHCRRQGYLKLVLDAPLDPDHAIALLGRCGLHYTRCRCGARHPRLEFYLDLYHRHRASAAEPARPGAAPASAPGSPPEISPELTPGFTPATA